MKAGSFPAKADAEKQRHFYDTVLQPLMKKAKRKNSAHVLLFLDASHFVLGCDFLGGVYSKARRFIRTFSGRQRYNVLGALNFMSKKIHTVTNASYITATEICQMLQLLAKEYTSKTIHVVLDNARYQKCEIVTSLAKDLAIDLVYLPSYSPNLNLIERLWKYVKSELRVKYYNNFKIFTDTIDGIIKDAGNESKGKISKLIGEKIQLYDDLIPVCENTLSSKPRRKNQTA